MAKDPIFAKTIAGLQQGFRVRDIATFGLIDCKPEETARTVLDGNSNIDQFPVREEDRVIGVLERGPATTNQSVRECLRPLDDSILVSPEDPLLDFIPLMEREPYLSPCTARRENRWYRDAERSSQTTSALAGVRTCSKPGNASCESDYRERDKV